MRMVFALRWSEVIDAVSHRKKAALIRRCKDWLKWRTIIGPKEPNRRFNVQALARGDRGVCGLESAEASCFCFYGEDHVCIRA